MTGLTPAQQAAVDCRDSRIALLAAPGSGKTRTLVERAASLMLAGFHPSELLLVTFTRASAAEMKARIVARMEGQRVKGLRQITVTTFHAMAARLLRAWADKLGLDPNFTIRDDDDRTDLIIYAGEELGIFDPKRPSAMMDAAGRKRRAASAFKKPEVREAYYRHLQEARALDYDSLQSELLRLLRLPGVAAQVARGWPHVLVDETQDTSAEQQAILDALDPRNLFVVGDTSQAIYGFRGANPDGFVDLTRRDGWTTLQLATNFRSRRPIVDAATTLGQVMAVPGLRQDAGREDADDPEGESSMATLDLPAGIDTWAPILAADLLQAKSQLGCAWRDCAILAPTWRELERLVPHLQALGLPASLSRRGGNVWTSTTMRWIKDGLRVASNPSDYLSLYAFINRVTVRVKSKDWALIRAAGLASGATPLESIASSDAVASSTKALAASVGVAQLEVASAVDAARRLAWAIGEAVLRDHLPSKADEASAALGAIVAWDAAQPEGERSVQDLLDALSEELVTPAAEGEEEEEEADEIHLGTIHGAKGLEWKAVWVLACEDGTLPRATNPGAGLEEERRLFYVAFTRAEERARVCWRSNRQRSRFVAEAGLAQLVDCPFCREPLVLDLDGGHDDRCSVCGYSMLTGEPLPPDNRRHLSRYVAPLDAAALWQAKASLGLAQDGQGPPTLDMPF